MPRFFSVPPSISKRSELGAEALTPFSSPSSLFKRRQLMTAPLTSQESAATQRRLSGAAIRPFLLRFSPRLPPMRHVVIGVLALLLCLGLVLMWVVAIRGQMGPFYAVQDVIKIQAWRQTVAVAVVHNAPLTSLNNLQNSLRRFGLASRTVMRRTQLPSWTLHVVEAACAECLDSATHAAAVARQLGSRSDAAAAAVFATPSAPLGLAGPMLFAMASVTDDVAVGAELARWGWVGRSRAVRRQFAGASPVGLKGGTTPYLVVSGIPSTDQPGRASLRDAQRATWLSYRDVARSENDFDGALLPLYIFAAAERELLQGVTDMSPLLPTVAEYEDASTMLLQDGANAALGYEERRVELVSDLLSIHGDPARFSESPCAKIITSRVVTGVDRGATWVSQLASALQLPVRPAAVAPAEFICHASAALWQEALAHRNMLWVDMMTDRRPTSKKELGGFGDWGLPVEVGMSQKLVLWLEYAYHAFPDVPYIMKNDDDTYLKVPQFVSDVRYMRAGFQGERAATVVGAPRDPVGIAKTEECIYWGSRYRSPYWKDLFYHEGSGYMMHRRIVEAIMEDDGDVNVYQVYLSVHPFYWGWKRTYDKSFMDVEDAFVGRMIRDKRQRIREVCPFKRGVYVEERKLRHCDLYSKDKHNVTWAAMLLHKLTPTDEYYLHYYFQHEHEVAAQVNSFDARMEEVATAEADAWLLKHVSPTLNGFRRRAELRWTHPKKDIASFLAAGDNVTIYAFQYDWLTLDALDVGFVSRVP